MGMTHPRPRPRPMSIEFEDESQSFVERYKFLVCHAFNEVAESFWCDGRRLLDQDLSLFIVDLIVGRKIVAAQTGMWAPRARSTASDHPTAR